MLLQYLSSNLKDFFGPSLMLYSKIIQGYKARWNGTRKFIRLENIDNEICLKYEKQIVF